MSDTNRYKIGTTRQLIDLNGQTTNFKIQFSMVSTEGEAFEAVVVDQGALDTNKQLQYRGSENGQLKGAITWDKDVYQNFYLILRAPSECEIDVTIEKEEIEPKPQNVPPPPPPEPLNPPIKPEMQVNQDDKLGGQYQQPPRSLMVPPVESEPVKKKFNFKWKWILVGVGVILLVLAGWYFFSQYKKRKSPQDSADPLPLEESPRIETGDVHGAPKIPSLADTSKNPGQGTSGELLDRLNALVV
jgi:hypothetical protein